MKSSHGLEYLRHLKIGIDELQWLQFEGHERFMRRQLAQFMSHGFVTGRTRRNSLGAPWRIHDDDDDGTISVYSGMERIDGGSYGSQGHAWAIDEDGYAIQLDAEIDVATLPNDSTWYTVVCRRKVEMYERGTLSVTVGSAIVNGVGTEFTRYAGVTTDAFGRGSRPRIAAGDTAFGHDGTYEIDQVVNDTQMVLTAAVNGTNNETGIPFTIAGDFATAPPVAPDIHQRWVPEFQVVARTRDPAAGDLILADVMRNDALVPKVTIIDRRVNNVYRRQPQIGASRGVDIQPEFTGAQAPPFTDVEIPQTMTIPTADATDIAVARKANDGFLWVARAADNSVMVKEYDSQTDNSQNPAGGGAVSLTAAGSYVALEQVPPNTGNTHVGFYVSSADNMVYQRDTTDNGQTWAAAAAIWDPTAVAANDRVYNIYALLLRNHRLVLFGAYYHWNAIPANTYTQIRYVYSDDYGATWNTNGNAGYNASFPAPAQDHDEPSAWQGPDGLIHLAYTYAGNIVGGVSVDDTGLSWTAAHPERTWVVNAIGAYTNMGPALYVTPDNIPVVLYSANWGTNQDLRVAVIGDDDSATTSGDDVIHDRRLFRVSMANGTNVTLAACWRQARNGSLFTLMVNDDGAASLQVLETWLKPLALHYGDTAVQEL